MRFQLVIVLVALALVAIAGVAVKASCDTDSYGGSCMSCCRTEYGMSGIFVEGDCVCVRSGK